MQTKENKELWWQKQKAALQACFCWLEQILDKLGTYCTTMILSYLSCFTKKDNSIDLVWRNFFKNGFSFLNKFQ